MPLAAFDRVRAVQWSGDAIELLDQRRLPFEELHLRCSSANDVARAIRDLVVRGAPAIGIAAAYAIALEASRVAAADGSAAMKSLAAEFATLQAARPTAVNLAWALARMHRVGLAAGRDFADRLLAEAVRIAEEDLAANRTMGVLGANLIAPGSGVLTHCNTGSLATAGFGTALGVVRAGVAQGRIERVFAGETRPWLQGARLTVWELAEDGIPATLIVDAAGAHLMKSGQVQWVVVGADRVCANGDVANKIGTYQLAIAAAHHGLGFMVVAPASTVDLATASGADIEIEERPPDELLGYGGTRTVAEGVTAWNPVFDVTPAALVTAFVSERGVIESPDAAKMDALYR